VHLVHCKCNPGPVFSLRHLTSLGCQCVSCRSDDQFMGLTLLARLATHGAPNGPAYLQLAATMQVHSLRSSCPAQCAVCTDGRSGVGDVCSR
jgi:hypothetical protein